VLGKEALAVERLGYGVLGPLENLLGICHALGLVSVAGFTAPRPRSGTSKQSAR
jgi:hypothetical protein